MDPSAPLQPKDSKPRLSLKRRKINGKDQIGKRKSLLKIEKLSLPLVAPKLKQKVVNKLQNSSEGNTSDVDKGCDSCPSKNVDDMVGSEGLDADSKSILNKDRGYLNKGGRNIGDSRRSDAKPTSDVKTSEIVEDDGKCSSNRVTSGDVMDEGGTVNEGSAAVDIMAIVDKGDEFDNRDVVEKGGVVGGGEGEGSGLGDLFFCHLCQKDLTKFTAARRQLHLNRCCDTDSAREKAVKESGQESSCVICHKKFTDLQVTYIPLGLA